MRQISIGTSFFICCFTMLLTGQALGQEDITHRFSLQNGETSLSGLVRQIDANRLIVRIVAKGGNDCYTKLAQEKQNGASEWTALCESLLKDGNGVFEGQMQRDPWSAALTFSGELKRSDTGFSRKVYLTADNQCFSGIGIGSQSSAATYRPLTGCVEKTASKGLGTPTESQTAQDAMRVLLERGDNRFVGYATRIEPNKLEVDMKFEARDAIACAKAFEADSGTQSQGWYRLCQTATRFGTLRLAGTLTATDGGTNKAYRGSLNGRDPGFSIDVDFQLSSDCVLRIATRGYGNLYASQNTSCSSEPSGREGAPSHENAGPSDKELADAINDWFGTPKQNSSDKSGLSHNLAGNEDSEKQGLSNAPSMDGNDDIPLNGQSATDRSNTLGPVVGADQDLFPKPGFGYFQLFLHNVKEGKRASQSQEDPWGVITLERRSRGEETIKFQSYRQCPNEVKQDSPAFCEMVQRHIGQTLAIQDYGFNGKYGIGRISDGDETWFIRLLGDSGKLEAHLLGTRLLAQSDLGINPTARDALKRLSSLGERSPVANADLYPLEGFGHLLAFIEHRMPVSHERPNALVQGGDVVFRGGSTTGRIHIEDFGQCPPSFHRRFCQETQNGIGQSWPLEDYRFNGAIGTAEINYSGTRYSVVLSKSGTGHIRAQFYLNDGADLGSFTTGLGEAPAGSEDQSTANRPTCSTGSSARAMHILNRPVTHNGQPLAWCSDGSCVDSNRGYAETLCAVAHLENLRRSGQLNEQTSELSGLFGKICAVEGSTQSAAQMKPQNGSAENFQDNVGRVIEAYKNHTIAGHKLDDWLHYEACINCKTIEVIACEIF